MKVSRALRKSHRLWVVLPLLIVALAVQTGVAGLAAQLPLPWAALAAFGWLPPYVALGAVLLRAIGARLTWRLDLANDTKYRVDVVLYPSNLPPFGRYVVLVDGREVGGKHEGWGARDRMAFRFGEDPSHEAEVTVSNTNLWPFRPVRVALDVDGLRLAEV